MKTLGIIGLGAMGQPMAKNLQKHGYSLLTTVRSERSRKLACELGITVLENPGNLPEHTDTVLLLVSNYQQCCQCLEGETGLFAAMTHGTVIVSSTIAPEQMRLLEEACPKGVCLLDAPVSGGVTGAEQGTLVTMAAGDAEAFSRCSDIFACYSKKAVYVGDKPGQGQMLKAVNQMLVGIHIAATAEAAAFSKALGLDQRALFETISECAGNSNMFQSRMPKLMAEDYSSRAALETLEKDTKICVDLAETAGVPCYLTELCHELYCKTPRSEDVQEDACAVIRMYQE